MATVTTTPEGTDVATVDVDAPAEVLWDLVADVTQMGRWSPECYRCTWLDGVTEPAVGARFRGWNRQDVGPLPLRWATTATVREATRGEVFSFTVRQAASTWTYRFADAPGGGTRVTETRADGDKPLVARIFFRIVPGRAERQRAGMVQTLDRLRAAAEAGAPPAG